MVLEDAIASLQNLDPDNIGSWPILVKIIIWVLTMIIGGFGVYQFKLSESFKDLESKKKEEIEQMQVFETKAFKSANLDKLQKQMADMEISFGALVKQLPSKAEVPGLLEDISQLGVDSGLEFNSIGLGAEKNEEFYAVQPIQIIVSGGYHALGGFVSGIAALPRIVTLHDFSLEPVGSSASELSLSIVAKTYRYIDREE